MLPLTCAPPLSLPARGNPHPYDVGTTIARGAADGLVAPDGVSKMLDWRPDGQRYCALYLGIDEPGIVCPQPGGAEFGYVPSTMALWVRSGTPS